MDWTTLLMGIIVGWTLGWLLELSYFRGKRSRGGDAFLLVDLKTRLREAEVENQRLLAGASSTVSGDSPDRAASREVGG